PRAVAAPSPLGPGVESTWSRADAWHAASACRRGGVVNSSSDDVRRTGSDAPTRTFGPPATVVVGTLVAAFVFVVVLEFLVLISFVGQRLWAHPDMLRDIVFTLPLVLWVLIAAA